MSRAYRIQVSESEERVIHVDDSLETGIQVLDVLPREEMAELLGEELKEDGYEVEDGIATKTEDGVVTEVELATGKLRIAVEAEEEVELTSNENGVYYDDVGPGATASREALKKKAKAGLDQAEERAKEDLQSEITGKLEGVMGDIKGEVNKASGRATIEALKKKAAAAGTIKEISEDKDNGSVTIVVDV